MANRIYSETLHQLERKAGPGTLLRNIHDFVHDRLATDSFYFTMAAVRLSMRGSARPLLRQGIHQQSSYQTTNSSHLTYLLGRPARPYNPSVGMAEHSVLDGVVDQVWKPECSLCSH
jgi:hypothetical protein